eukprot:1351210-Amphidinium_carterae.1
MTITLRLAVQPVSQRTALLSKTYKQHQTYPSHMLVHGGSQFWTLREYSASDQQLVKRSCIFGITNRRELSYGPSQGTL